MALIVSGEPNASDGKPGFAAEDECFPQALRYQVGSDGRVLPVRTEPVAGDARQDKDGKTNAKLKLLAGLLDVNFDALRQREQERRRRSLLQVTGAALLISVAMSLVAVYAVVQERKAKKQTKAAEYARGQADGLINFMLHDLRDKLEPIGRLDVLDDVAKKAKEYLDGLPKELLTASRLEQQSALLTNLGDVLKAQGKLPEALDSQQQALAIAKRLAEQDKTNSGWQRDLATSFNRVGNVLMAQDKLSGALDAYQQSLAILKRLAGQDESNAGSQKNLSLGYEMVGDVLAAQGKLAEALDAYRQDLAIMKRLAEQDKSNADWQQDLGGSYEKVGDAFLAQGKLLEALDDYGKALAISDTLASGDPSNAEWQNNAAWTRYCVAKVLMQIKDGDRNEANGLVAEGIEIIKRREHQGALDRDAQDTLDKLNEDRECARLIVKALITRPTI